VDRFIDTKLKEYQQHIRMEHPDKSAMAQHSIKLWHRIQLHTTTILFTNLRYMEHIISVAIESGLHPNNVNREDGFCLRKS
jgi:hypothetical protein